MNGRKSLAATLVVVAVSAVGVSGCADTDRDDEDPPPTTNFQVKDEAVAGPVMI